MKSFNMFVKTVIYNEEGKFLLLKEKREDNKQRWDLPGAAFTEEQSFDETVINNVQKEIGYYVYPGKIVGIANHTEKDNKKVFVIMDGTILNGELLLSKDYDAYTWVHMSRLKEYPLVPWLHSYINNTKYPFQDVETEIEEMTNKKQRRREIIQEDIKNSVNPKNHTEKINNGVKSSFTLLKETIKKTFHPKQAHVTQTTPKSKEGYEEDYEENKDAADKLNFRFRNSEPREEYLNPKILETKEDDIIIEHDDDDSEEININTSSSDDIIIDHSDSEDTDDTTSINVPEKEKTTKVFDMNVNKENNMSEKESKSEPEIQVIRHDEETPLIRTEKESKQRVSFNSENIIRSGWKEKINRINRTEANDKKKTIPRPKGRK